MHIQKTKRKWRSRSSAFIWHTFHLVRKSMSAKKVTLKDGRHLTGRVSFLRSRLVCKCQCFMITEMVVVYSSTLKSNHISFGNKSRSKRNKYSAYTHVFLTWNYQKSLKIRTSKFFYTQWWPRVFTPTIAHYTMHHYRISILNRSYFPQFRTNLSETLHVGEFCWYL